VERMRLPRPFVPVVRLLASASLFIYLTHWVVYPAWEASAPWFGTVLSLFVGIAAWYLYRLILRALDQARSTRFGRRKNVRGHRAATRG
jgi:peptidoglycan/LPS O-acetylase OafA/YrhL